MNETHSRLLVVDDDDVTRKLLREILEKENYDVQLAASGEEAVRAIRREVFAIVLSDIRMFELDGMAVLREVKKTGAGTAVILMTGFGSMEGAVEAIHEGAFDYVSKPFKIDGLKAVVARAAKHWESIHQQKSPAPAALDGKTAAGERPIIGKSPRIVEVYKMLARAAMSTSTVLVVGESGTGKELVARAIHDKSPRKKHKYVAVSCDALAEPLLEVELFGHASDKAGLFEEAAGGTLFLDEIGDLSPALQIKLLRALQDGEIKPVGATEYRKIDVRVIAATHQDLDQLVRAGKFREDLYYRLKVILIEIPPLRERMEDLPELAGYFLGKYCDRNKKPVSHISEEGIEILKRYSWPGNVRELEHAIERAVAMVNSNVLFPEDFPEEVTRGTQGQAPVATGGVGARSSLEDMERAHILKVLQDVNYNKSRASEVLGIDRATLYRKAQRYGIDLRGK